jgi:hypothetical protein
MNARYLTDYPLDGYLHTRRSRVVALRRDKFNLRPLFESLGWMMAGATVGSVAVMMGGWGLLQLTEPRHVDVRPVTAINYQLPSTIPQP